MPENKEDNVLKLDDIGLNNISFPNFDSFKYRPVTHVVIKSIYYKYQKVFSGSGWCAHENVNNMFGSLWGQYANQLKKSYDHKQSIPKNLLTSNIFPKSLKKTKRLKLN